MVNGKYVDWRRKSVTKARSIQKENPGKEIEHKELVWKRKDTNNEYNEQSKKHCYFGGYQNNFFNEQDWDFRIRIPNGVQKLDKDAFKNHIFHINEIHIPTSVTSIPKKCMNNCHNLTRLTFPLTDKEMICSNRIYKNTSTLTPVVYLPTSLILINGKEVDGSSFKIPTTITCIDENSFRKTRNHFVYLEIPESVVSISIDAIENCYNLTSIKLPLNETRVIFGNKLFNNNPHFN